MAPQVIFKDLNDTNGKIIFYLLPLYHPLEKFKCQNGNNKGVDQLAHQCNLICASLPFTV